MTFLLLSIFLAILAMGYDCPFIGPEGTMPKGPQFPPALRLRDALDPLLGYKIVAPIWVGLTGEDEEKVTFEGTVQEAFDQLRRLKSNASNITFATETVHNDKAYCYIAGPGAKGMAPQGQVKADANNYLRHLGGSLHMPPGPRICSRVSCSWCSGIWLCNDNSVDIFIRSEVVADYVIRLADYCYETHTRTHQANYVMGQLFSGEKRFNVIVSGADC